MGQTARGTPCLSEDAFASTTGLRPVRPLLPGAAWGPRTGGLSNDLLASGRLQSVLPKYSPPAVPLSMLIVPERAGIARVRLMVDFLAREIARIPGIERQWPDRRVAEPSKRAR
jgi:hypothetical protein